MFGALKDMAVSQAITKKLEPLLAPYCQTFTLALDSTAKTLTVDALPKGETTPVRVEIRGYRLEREDDRAVLGFESLTASREWIGALALAFLPEKRIRLPENAPYELLKQYI